MNLNATFAGSETADNFNNKLYMKIFKFLMIALVAIVGLSSCEKDCDHDFIEMDYSNDIVGTWTCLSADHAEALVFKADGSFASYGISNGGYSEELNATWVLKNNKLTLSAGDYKSNVTLEIVPGTTMALVDEKGKRNVFEYCANDLSDDIVGMWVCNDAPVDTENNMGIQVFDANGIATLTGYTSQAGDFIVKSQANYKIIGDLLIQKLPEENLIAGVSPYLVLKVVYAPNENALGDMMIQKRYVDEGGNTVEKVSSWLRVKESLNLAGEKYGYSNIFITNVKGLDKEIDFKDFQFNFAKMDGSILDEMLTKYLFTIEFPDAETIKYTMHHNTLGDASEQAPIAVDGNKMTIKMSETYPCFKDVDFYAFQDVDGCQLHMYMPTYSFVNFFGNMQVLMMSMMEELDLTDAAAVKAVYDNIDEAVETINVSFVMEK